MKKANMSCRYIQINTHVYMHTCIRDKLPHKCLVASKYPPILWFKAVPRAEYLVSQLLVISAQGKNTLLILCPTLPPLPPPRIRHRTNKKKVVNCHDDLTCFFVIVLRTNQSRCRCRSKACEQGVNMIFGCVYMTVQLAFYET